MARLIFAVLLVLTSALAADDSKLELEAPKGWDGETISLPPGFARDMKLKGAEHIRFAPGMMKPDSDTFFCYAFVFELASEPELTEAVLKDEFLKYYRGLCTAVLGDREPEVDTSEFALKLEKLRAEEEPANATQYHGVLEWVEPFATRKPQKLNLEFIVWSNNDHQYLFACVSPQPKEADIWKQLRAIRNGYLKKQKTLNR